MKKSICILEDNITTREILEFLLTEEDYDVYSCSNARDFWQEMSSHLPDMIVLDIHLQDGNGLDICNRLKANSKTHNIPVMMMSGDNYLNKVKAKCPADEFINKPFNINDFMDRVVHYAPN
ncbi:MAG: response regulator [Sphingobacteriales bacterium]|nr:MAG: response regulator [Sphingobacteriales bacterium]